MISVLIVDDEYLVRKGIMETIKWKDYGFEVIGEAADGIEGFEKYMELRPDIIITDIRMKRASGLELISRLQQLENFDSKIIIISAYDDFNYAKKALECNVSAYLLKPIQENELVSAMLHLKSEIEENREMTKIAEDIKEQMPKIRNAFIKDVFDGNINNIEKVNKKADLYNIDMPHNEYVAVCIKVDDMMSEPEDTKQLQKDLEETIKYCEKLFDSFGFISCVISECFMALLLFDYDDNYEKNQILKSPLTDFLNTIKEQFETVTGRTVSIGYSMRHKNIEEIHTAYEEAKKALAHKSFVGNNSIIDYNSVPKTMNSALIMPREEIEDVLRMINSDNYIGAKKIFDEFFTKIKQDPSIDIESLKDVVIEISIMIVRLHFRNFEEMHDVFGYNVIPSNEIKKLENVNQIEKWIANMISKIFEKSNNGDKSDYIREVKNIINKRFNQNLTAENIAEEMYISPYYLMHIFKDETGMTFNQYLTKVRIDKAAQLMKSRRYKIYEIAEMVGYNDAAYFSYIFKKITGHSPKKAMSQF